MNSRKSTGPIGWLLNLFSSVWLGVTLLFLLFIYSSVGSAGAPTSIFILRPENWVSVRQLRAFELTEFEWFNWWPFDLLIGLICINVTVATLRRIPFNKLNFGVWTIHTGILILCAGSVWYFSTKLEGDTPVARRRIVAALPNGEMVSMLAKPGNQTTLGSGDQLYTLQIANIDPTWELLSGEDKGKKAYVVNVRVTTPSQTFTRQLLAGYPQYTEDVVRNPNAKPGEPPMTRAKKINPDGNPLVDDTLQLSLGYEPQSDFYLMDSSAVYLRKVGETEWIQRPIEGLPHYNDYLADPDDAINLTKEETTPLGRTLTVASNGLGDPLPADLSITGYLRYAEMGTHQTRGGPVLNPAITIRVGTPDGKAEEGRLVAFDPAQSVVGGGRLRFKWFGTEEEIESYTEVEPATLHITVPEAEFDETVLITEVQAANPELAFTPIEGTEYAWRVQRMSDNLTIEGRNLSLAFVEIQKGEKTWVRWVFDTPGLSRDVPDENTSGGMTNGHQQSNIIDEGIEMVYGPGKYPAPVTIAAGPEPSTLRLIRTFGTETGEAQITPLGVGAQGQIELMAGMNLTVLDYIPRAQTVLKPQIVPRNQRDRNMRRMASMIQVQIPGTASGESVWLDYHEYPFDTEDEALLRYSYQPTMVTLKDGTNLEMIFSRRRVPLPAPVALDDFRIATHVGGFSGQTSSIRNWTSIVRFEEGQSGSEGWGEHREVSVNEPTEYKGFWFYQAQWDPPFNSAGFSSAGLNYTVLGVGNRNGVVVQLAGCCIAVFGMIYAFYFKPYLKRKRQQEVYSRVAAAGALEATHEPDEPIAECSPPPETHEPVGAGAEDMS